MSPIIIFIVLTLFSFIMDVLTNTCIFSCSMTFILFIHHIINIFIYFGWLFNAHNVLLFHVVFPLLVLLHWKTNNNRCFLTQIINEYCGYDDGHPFHDLLYMVGLKNYVWFNNYGIYFVVGISSLLSLYKIM